MKLLALGVALAIAIVLLALLHPQIRRCAAIAERIVLFCDAEHSGRDD